MPLVNPQEPVVLPEALEVWQRTLNWQPTSKQQSKFQNLYTEILKGNQRLNLTRITDPAEFWEKHLWDSLCGIQPWLNQSERSLQVIDVGTGAGFPGVPVAIVCPQWRITLLDSTQKKIAFLADLIATLQLKAEAITDRAERLGHLVQHREKYDLALIRAVATASVCAEYTLPLLKVGGSAVLYRGQWSEAETQGLQIAAKQLGGCITQIERFETPLSQSVRHCIYLKKVELTRAIFPRAIGVPTQKPL
ncbi:16S rRNA (guanine(527)-N(7))-methyltransferase RsmG [Leptolyngbya sp. NK1-12]|uniref:Ribosomal RNA small subunit methyltransferase G n=1 Tax=Leptolyngbya sp. NK1-12 TaxID=2547451 RepID=A0AA97AI78_9CYAN|nr:16S rRNA (guanine(527)-N(7))-methyltransferase RsmG [Leptolyngbya sp. NK1-12]WNZ25274.1 16S rRNA (guanine(527)-N(7))-methyltransferase RsmG [Leptolyngbya sp. NK1-12]